MEVLTTSVSKCSSEDSKLLTSFATGDQLTISPKCMADAFFVTPWAAEVHLMRSGQVRPFQETLDLKTGDVITTGPTTAVIAYDGGKTRVEIQRDSVVQFADAAGGKHLELRQGALTARVAPQATGHPMLITTLHARATVIGTEFKLRAEPANTTLEVLEGKVQFTCRFDSKKVMVTGGFSSTADISGPVSVVPLLQPIPTPPK